MPEGEDPPRRRLAPDHLDEGGEQRNGWIRPGRGLRVEGIDLSQRIGPDRGLDDLLKQIRRRQRPCRRFQQRLIEFGSGYPLARRLDRDLIDLRGHLARNLCQHPESLRNSQPLGRRCGAKAIAIAIG
ncbi:hypothetical protein [Methylomarinovum caldicuralii]|uniref:hypothetical protein n=1 Tax=Methylomarinovum caldicuralii TaxID=438856 RepID=UPI002953B07E|nr:hypothetical protein [Methylomarinovum caldicuralii]